MTFFDKFKLFILTILSLGLIWIWLNKKKKKSNILSSKDKITINLAKLKEAIGEENIISVSNTQNKLKIEIKNNEIINKELIKKLKGISGTIFSSNSITLIVGNTAAAIAKKIK